MMVIESWLKRDLANIDKKAMVDVLREGNCRVPKQIARFEAKV